MGWLDRVPGAGNLFISGLYALRRKDALKEANITHVLSVINLELDVELFKPYEHVVIDVDDVDDENLLEHFPAAIYFIQDGLDGGGGVLVHCAMGKSRSAACVMAYLMHKFGLSPEAALAQLQQGRGVCDPNTGFKEQLELYHKMGAPAEIKDNSIYQRWLYDRALAQNREVRQAPEIDIIQFADEKKDRFEDKHREESLINAPFELKCRKCRRILASSNHLVKHEPKRATQTPQPVAAPVPPTACSHYFLDALSWMRPELEQGKLEGRLECPKCQTNVGKYAWQGMQCSCGDWVVPGISLAKSRVDKVKPRTGPDGNNSSIRMPASDPKLLRGPNQGNL